MSEEQITPEQMKERIQTWLMDIGYQIGTPTDDNSRFHLAVTTPLGTLVDVLQPNTQSDMVILGAGYQLTPEQTKRLKELNERRRDEFLWDLRFSLVLGHFSFDVQPASQALLEKVIITDTLYYDGITKNSFMKSFDHVHRGLMFTMWKLGKELGGLTPATQRPIK